MALELAGEPIYIDLDGSSRPEVLPEGVLGIFAGGSGDELAAAAVNAGVRVEVYTGIHDAGGGTGAMLNETGQDVFVADLPGGRNQLHDQTTYGANQNVYRVSQAEIDQLISRGVISSAGELHVVGGVAIGDARRIMIATSASRDIVEMSDLRFDADENETIQGRSVDELVTKACVQFEGGDELAGRRRAHRVLAAVPEHVRTHTFRYDSKLHKQHWGNIVANAALAVEGDIAQGFALAQRCFQAQAEVHPITYSPVFLEAIKPDGTVVTGEHDIDIADITELASLRLWPDPKVNRLAAASMLSAESLVVSAGSDVTSIRPLFLVSGVDEAFRSSVATVKGVVPNAISDVNSQDAHRDPTRRFKQLILEQGLPINTAFIHSTGLPPEVADSEAKKGHYAITFGDIEYAFLGSLGVQTIVRGNLLYAGQRTYSDQGTITRSPTRHVGERVVLGTGLAHRRLTQVAVAD